MDKISVVSRQNEDRRKSALRERGISRLMKKRTAILLKPADTEFIAWRQDIQRFKQHYVSSLPCKEHPGAAHKALALVAAPVARADGVLRALPVLQGGQLICLSSTTSSRPRSGAS
jgi:hypothetical protein